MSIPEIHFLKLENKKLRQFIYLFELEIEFKQRISEINENFLNSEDASQLVKPLINRLEKITSEKTSLKKELRLK